MKKCKHIFKSDGGQCIKCRKTVVELMDEEDKKFETEHEFGFWGQFEDKIYGNT